jgi:hypothetical protein
MNVNQREQESLTAHGIHQFLCRMQRDKCRLQLSSECWHILCDHAL